MRILVIEGDLDAHAVLVQGLAESGQEAISSPDFAGGLAAETELALSRPCGL